MRIAIIGAGISGLTISNLLKNYAVIKTYEKNNRPGGLIKCDEIEGSLFHRCGGHVFNTKREDVFEFFWSKFDKNKEFLKADRNAVIQLNKEQIIPYPIENYLYELDKSTVNKIIDELIDIQSKKSTDNYLNFEDFLIKNFGPTLYDIYFRPYNTKIWQADLSSISIDWLNGKLPVSNFKEIILNNIFKVKENNFVHSSFYYELKGGSQFVANRLAKDLDIEYNIEINKIEKKNKTWVVNNELFDLVVFCGNIKQLPNLINLNKNDTKWIKELPYHGTTSVFCEIDSNNYSWIYLPEPFLKAHRIICTGNFSPNNNNCKGRLTGTIEFTDYISKEELLQELKKVPYNPRYITHAYHEYTYPIQTKFTRTLISKLKETLANQNFFMIGRFADWEYYNMDVAMGAALDLSKEIINKHLTFPNN